MHVLVAMECEYIHSNAIEEHVMWDKGIYLTFVGAIWVIVQGGIHTVMNHRSKLNEFRQCASKNLTSKTVIAVCVLVACTLLALPHSTHTN